MIETAVKVTVGLVMMMSFVALWRAYKGPRAADRVVAINVTTTKVATIIVMIALVTAQKSYVSVALVYAMIGFIATIGVAKYLIKGKLG